MFLVVYVVQQGSKVFSWSFLNDDLPFVDRLPGGGMGPAVVGTLLITGAASLMAIPLGILGGIYLNEYGGKSPLARFIRFLSEVMTGVPSIVMGLFIYTLVVLNTKEKNGFAGALALACLMLPIVIRTTDQMLSLVPSELREGSYALGSRKARTIRTVVLPNAAAGIVSGALLAVARAAGETAPLLFTIGTTRRGQHQPVQRPEHRAVGADLRQRDVAVHGAAGPGLGRRAHAHPDRVHHHHRRPSRDGLLRPPAGGMTPEDGSMPTLAEHHH